jgi:hypothetical protein
MLNNEVETKRKALIAQATLEWVDLNRLSFLWGGRLIFCHYDRDNGFFRILTHLDYEEEQEVSGWFAGNLNKVPKQREQQGAGVEEENRD